MVLRVQPHERVPDLSSRSWRLGAPLGLSAAGAPNELEYQTALHCEATD
jgi:hypothetical protein